LAIAAAGFVEKAKLLIDPDNIRLADYGDDAPASGEGQSGRILRCADSADTLTLNVYSFFSSSFVSDHAPSGQQH